MTKRSLNLPNLGLTLTLVGTAAWAQEPAPLPATPPAQTTPAPAQTTTPPPATTPAAAPATTPVAAPAKTDAASPAKAKPAMAQAPVFSEEVKAAIGAPVPGKGKIVFFRASGAGALLGFIVRENDKELGKLRSSKYFTLDVEPGKHTYVVHSEAEDKTTLEVEEGETYFVNLTVSMGFFAGHPHLHVTDLAAFEKVVKKLELAKPLS